MNINLWTIDVRRNDGVTGADDACLTEGRPKPVSLAMRRNLNLGYINLVDIARCSD